MINLFVIFSFFMTVLLCLSPSFLKQKTVFLCLFCILFTVNTNHKSVKGLQTGWFFAKVTSNYSFYFVDKSYLRVKF